MERWQNKVAVITGASSGIGAALCKNLLSKGMIVVGMARRLDRMENELKPSLPLEQQSKFHAIRCDVSQESDIVAAFATVEKNFGGTDVLINNAGTAKMTQIVAENNTADLKSIIDTNVLGVAFCTREAFRSMKARGVDGHVVIVNSILGHYIPMQPGAQSNVYPASKHAVTAMTEMLRQEFIVNDTKIKVTSVSPGLTDTELLSERLRNSGMPMLKAEDIADAITYCIQTPPHVQIHEMIIKPVGEKF